MERGSGGNRITSTGERVNLATGRHQEEGLRGSIPFAMPSLPGTTEMRLKIVMFTFVSSTGFIDVFIIDMQKGGQPETPFTRVR